MIRPTVECVGQITNTNHIGVLATIGTIISESYPMEISKLYPDITVSGEACPMLLPLGANNEAAGSGAEYFIRKNISHLLDKAPEI